MLALFTLLRHFREISMKVPGTGLSDMEGRNGRTYGGGSAHLLISPNALWLRSSSPPAGQVLYVFLFFWPRSSSPPAGQVPYVFLFFPVLLRLLPADQVLYVFLFFSGPVLLRRGVAICFRSSVSVPTRKRTETQLDLEVLLWVQIGTGAGASRISRLTKKLLYVTFDVFLSPQMSPLRRGGGHMRCVADAFDTV